jgi:hypothetical protein
MEIETLAIEIAQLSNVDLAKLADVLMAQFNARAEKLAWNLQVSSIDQDLRGDL